MATTLPLVDVFFPITYNKALEKSPYGVVVNHTKHEKCVGPYAMMVVIGRMVMRRLLENEVEKIRAEMKKEGGFTEQALERMAESYTLTPHLGPFDEDGRCFDVGQLGRMYKWLGQRARGLPNFGVHIIRSNHATAVATYCVKNGLPVEHQAVKDLFAFARHGDRQRIRFYSHVKADTPDSCPYKENLGGVTSTLRHINAGTSVMARDNPVATLRDIRDVGVPGVLVFDVEPNESVRG